MPLPSWQTVITTCRGQSARDFPKLSKQTNQHCPSKGWGNEETHCTQHVLVLVVVAAVIVCLRTYQVVVYTIQCASRALEWCRSPAVFCAVLVVVPFTNSTCTTSCCYLILRWINRLTWLRTRKGCIPIFHVWRKVGWDFSSVSVHCSYDGVRANPFGESVRYILTPSKIFTSILSVACRECVFTRTKVNKVLRCSRKRARSSCVYVGTDRQSPPTLRKVSWNIWTL